MIEAALAAHPVRYWLEKLGAAGVPCGPIQNVEQVLNHPQTQARNMVIAAEDADLGTVKMAGNPIKMSGHADPEVRTAAPDLDADREKILKELGL